MLVENTKRQLYILLCSLCILNTRRRKFLNSVILVTNKMQYAINYKNATNSIQHLISPRSFIIFQLSSKYNKNKLKAQKRKCSQTWQTPTRAQLSLGDRPGSHSLKPFWLSKKVFLLASRLTFPYV